MEYAIAHHGIEGQKWGVRRWQNPDGTLTEAGKKRYGKPITGTQVGLRDKRAERQNAQEDAWSTYARDLSSIRSDFRSERKNIKSSSLSKQEKKDNIRKARSERDEKAEQAERLYAAGLKEVDRIFAERYSLQDLERIERLEYTEAAVESVNDILKKLDESTD